MPNTDEIKSYYTNRLESGTEQDFLFQVGKTLYGKPVDYQQIEILLTNLNRVLQLNKKDQVLDIGCANGFLTYRLAPLVKHITALDISSQLLSIAKTYHTKSNISYLEGDILCEDVSDFTFNKIYMYEVLQHLPYSGLRLLLSKLVDTGRTFQFFIGGIPDAERIFNFYSDPAGKVYYFKTLENQEAHLGNWWYKEHIISICDELQVNCQILAQPQELYTAHYRFDCLLGVSG